MTNNRITKVFGQRRFSTTITKPSATKTTKATTKATALAVVASFTSTTATAFLHHPHPTTALLPLSRDRSSLFVPPLLSSRLLLLLLLPSQSLFVPFFVVTRPYSISTPIRNTMQKSSSSSLPENNDDTSSAAPRKRPKDDNDENNNDTPVATTTTATTNTTNNNDNNNEPTSIQSRKKSLRKQIRTKLRSLSPSTIQSQSHKVWTKLCALPEYQSARSVGLFLSMPSGEIDTREICRMVWNGDGDGDGVEQKDLYVPRVGLDFEHPSMEMTLVPPRPSSSFSFSSKKKPKADDDDDDDWLPYDDWPRNKWGIPEAPMDNDDNDGDGDGDGDDPPSTTTTTPMMVAKPGDIDLLIVPGLAFDAFGGRLGQGKGYYDRFIADITITTTATATTTVGEELGEDDEEEEGGGGVKRRKKNDDDDTNKNDDGGGGSGNNETIEKRKKPLLVAVGLEPSFIDGGERIPMAEYDVGMDRLIVPHKEVMVFR